MISVTLSPADLSLAEQIAEQRERINRQAGRGAGRVVIGSFEAQWSGMIFDDAQWRNWRRTHGNGDVGILEVRTTRKPAHRLILHPHDDDRTPFVLVLDDCPRFRLCGWIMARSGKRPEYWEDVGHGQPCYYVPHAKLCTDFEFLRVYSNAYIRTV